MSALALAILAMGWIQLERRLRSAVAGELDGVSVAITHDIGPAVVGIVRPRIVIPRLAAAARRRDTGHRARARARARASARHSRARRRVAHCGAAAVESADLVAAAQAALSPWKSIATRACCEAGQSRSSYSTVLLNVATHLVPLRAAAAGLSESGSSLEKRIRIMHTPLRARWRLLVAFLGSCSVALVAVAAHVTAPRFHR